MILIVDDKAENIFSLSRTLQVHGFETDAAASGEEALRKILKNDYSLIILDVQMPGMDGFEVAEAISGFSKVKDVPIIFLSAVNTDKKFITKGYISGGVDYITKPVDADIFLLKVKTLHRLYEQNRELQSTRAYLTNEIEIRKQAEEALNRKVAELHSILEAIPQLAFTLTDSGSIEYVNEKWYLYSAHEHEMPAFHPEDSEVRQQWEQAVLHKTGLVCEVRLYNLPAQEYRYHLLKMVPVWSNERLVKWVGTFTDIDLQKSANKVLESKVDERTRELLQKNGELEASNYELQQFASVASHDLKEPLRKIQVCSSILQESPEAQHPSAVIQINRIVASATRMSILINDLINHSRLSIDSLFEPASLRGILDEVISDLELSVKEKAAVLEIGDFPVIDAIPGQMRQVFQNLVSNALKFSRPDIQPVIRIGTERVTALSATALPDPEGPYCRITVADNGIGFDEQYTDKVFTIFQRLNPKDTYEGTGIGLAIVKKIVEKHRGIINARSHPGAGSTFIIVLPIKQHGE